MRIFVEQPLFRTPARTTSRRLLLETSTSAVYLGKGISFAADMESQGKEKAIEIELVTETQLPSDTTAVQLHQETWKIRKGATEGIQEQQRKSRQSSRAYALRGP